MEIRRGNSRLCREYLCVWRLGIVGLVRYYLVNHTRHVQPAHNGLTFEESRNAAIVDISVRHIRFKMILRILINLLVSAMYEICAKS